MPDSSTRPDVRLVIPAFREAGRLPAFLAELRTRLAEAPWSSAILVVDDGSPAEAQRALAAAVPPAIVDNCEVLAPLLLPENRRKGGAVLAGWRAGPGRWRAFVDADGAVPAAEVRRVLDAVVARDDPAIATFAVRRRSGPHRVHRRLPRAIANRVFSRLASAVAGTPIEDSQCGFKIVSAPAWERIAPAMRGSGFCFDVELLARLHRAGVAIEQVPIAWQERRGGHVRVWRDGGGMLRELWRLRRSLRHENRGGPSAAFAHAHPTGICTLKLPS